MSRLEDEKKPEDLHDKNLSSEAEERRENVTPPDTSRKKEGVTSTFSAATGDAGKYSGEDISDVEGDTGDDQDKVAN
jgi:hypothetical protein